MKHFNDDFPDICRLATKTWGVESQEAMAVGEIGELLTMFGRRVQYRDCEDQWIDEIADCLIMLNQLAHLHGYNKVEDRVGDKIHRLRLKLMKANAVEL